MRKELFGLLFIFLALNSFGQELRCNVSVSSSRIEGTYKEIYQTMRTDIYEFMNNRKWTDNVYTFDERIECTIFIQLTEQVSADEFKGSIQVQMTRPIFNSSYESPVLNIRDENFQVRYVEFQPLEFDETNNSNALTNILAYYAYIITTLFRLWEEHNFIRKPVILSIVRKMHVKRDGERLKETTTVFGLSRIC